MLEEEAKKLETKPDILIYNALLLMLEKLKRDKRTQSPEDSTPSE